MTTCGDLLVLADAAQYFRFPYYGVQHRMMIKMCTVLEIKEFCQIFCLSSGVLQDCLAEGHFLWQGSQCLTKLKQVCKNLERADTC